MSPRAQATAGALLAVALICLYTVVGNPITLVLAVILAAVGFGMAARDARANDDRALAAWHAEQRTADIAWWRGAAHGEHPAERAVAPAVLLALGDTEPVVGPRSRSGVSSANEPARPPAVVLERAAALTEGNPSVADLRAMAGTWEALAAHTGDPTARRVLRVDILAARHLQAEAERVRAEAQAMVRTRVGEMQRSAIRHAADFEGECIPGL